MRRTGKGVMRAIGFSGQGEGRRVAVSVSGALLFAALLSACASAPPKDTYGLTSVAAVTGPARKGRQVLIADPVATKLIDSDGIVVRVGGQEYQYLGDSQWSDRLPKVVQLKLAQAFNNSGRVGAAGLPGEGLAIDYQIQTTINAFEISAGGGTANVEISARLLNDRNGTVKAQQVFRAAVPISGSGDKAYIRALDAAFSAVSGDLVNWALAPR